MCLYTIKIAHFENTSHIRKFSYVKEKIGYKWIAYYLFINHSLQEMACMSTMLNFHATLHERKYFNTENLKKLRHTGTKLEQ